MQVVPAEKAAQVFIGNDGANGIPAAEGFGPNFRALRVPAVGLCSAWTEIARGKRVRAALGGPPAGLSSGLIVIG